MLLLLLMFFSSNEVNNMNPPAERWKIRDTRTWTIADVFCTKDDRLLRCTWVLCLDLAAQRVQNIVLERIISTSYITLDQKILIQIEIIGGVKAPGCIQTDETRFHSILVTAREESCPPRIGDSPRSRKRPHNPRVLESRCHHVGREVFEFVRLATARV